MNHATAPVTAPRAARKNPYKAAFLLMTSLFFMWGAIVSLNDVLIPHLKSLFNMNYTQTMLIQFCYFGAYFTMAIPASRIIGRIGYKQGIVLGLAIVGIGCLIFLPAASLISYGLFLFGLFVMASGNVFLQVVGNPYVSILGAPETASSRLNLAQGVNSAATTLAPLFGAYLILGQYSSSAAQAASVQGPYIGLAVAAFIMAGFFIFAHLPAVMSTDHKKVPGQVLRFRQLRLGVIALTLYVGAEVSIGSFIVSFLGEPYIAGLPAQTAAKYIPLYWGGLMIGRFAGSAILQRVRAPRVLAWAAVGAFVLVGATILTRGRVAMWTMLLTGLCNSIMWSNIFAMAIDGLGDYTIKASGILVMAPVGGAVLPLLQGVLADWPVLGLHASYILPLVCYLFILFYALNGYKPGKNEPVVAV
ncbi:MAG TPA: sugar MFS transporter [bacterium]|nr:sugar MFS transporter [bacterium]HPR87943.1 sugar MFS transporter [bacterium]